MNFHERGDAGTVNGSEFGQRIIYCVQTVCNTVMQFRRVLRDSQLTLLDRVR